MDNSSASSIKSVKAYRTGRDLNNTTIEMKSDESITVEFDDLSDEGVSFDYTIIHCTYDWQPSDLIFMDYCDGFEYNRVDDFQNSVGTISSYIHYSLTFPNNNINFKISGNYILRIVDSYDHSKIYVQQRFMVVEPLLSMNARVRQPLVQDLLLSSQQLELEVNIGPLGNIDPYNDIVTVVYQNNQVNDGFIGVKPTYIEPKQIKYSAPDALIFDGDNEYRNVNLKSYSYQTQQVQKIEIYGGETHINLLPDRDIQNQDYTENPDLNGKYIVKRDDSNDSNIEADYAWVYFTLQTFDPENVDVYLYGEFTGWTVNPDFKLSYNPQSGGYELRTFLKQGYYNYRYIAVDRQTGEVSHSRFEGNHFSTENTYQINVYYKSPGIRYWRLVGIKTISSRYSVG
ncbi:MAG: type IX secretion system plug protein domain-containing protein [Bacteroidales bacterium]